MEIGTSSSPDNWGSTQAPAPVPQSFGTPQSTLDQALVLPFNDVDGTLRLLERHYDEIAVVFVDLMPVRMGLVAIDPAYVKAVRDFTKQRGIVLIFDEVVTFRLAYGGGQSLYGVEPDITVLGKLIGGGLPVGAVAGKSEFMSVFDPRNGGPRVWQGGTFNANPVTMTAGLASMQLLTKSAFEHLDGLGDYARKMIAAVLDEGPGEWQITGRGSMFRIHPNKCSISNYRQYYQPPEERAIVGRLMERLMDNGIYMTRMGVASLSTAMERKHIDRFADALARALDYGCLIVLCFNACDDSIRGA